MNKVFYISSILIFANILSVSSQDLNPIESIIVLVDSLKSKNPDESLQYAFEALKLAELKKSDDGQLKSWIRIADIYWGKTELDKALHFAEQAKSLAQQIHRPSEYVDALIILGNIFSALGEFDKSADLLFEALRITERENDKKRTSRVLNRIGFNYFDLGSFEKALDYYSQSMLLAEELNDSEGIAMGLNNLAATYASMGIFTDFERNIEKAIRVNKNNNNQEWLGVNYLNLGSANAQQNNYEEAFSYFDLARSIFQEINQLEKLAKVYIELANINETIGNEHERLLYAEMAFNLARDNHLLRMQYLSSKEMHAIYISKNDTLKAYTYSRIESQIKDSLEIAKNNTRLNHLELLYDIEKKELERAAKIQRRNFTTRLVIISLIFGLISISLLLLRYRIKVKYTKLKQEKLENELDFKKREMTSNALNLMKKNEALMEIASLLKGVLNKAVKDETKHAIKRITKLLEKTTENDTWEDFEKRFNEVHQDFYSKLHQHAPNLSPNELRLCAFLKLNMSTKDISALTGQKVESLEKARTRLRKKLGITNTNINLVSFLSQF